MGIEKGNIILICKEMFWQTTERIQDQGDQGRSPWVLFLILRTFLYKLMKKKNLRRKNLWKKESGEKNI